MSEITDLAADAMVRSAPQGKMFDLKLNFISPAMDGEKLTADARVIHAGRRTLVTECTVHGPDGRLVATASATFAVTREKE